MRRRAALVMAGLALGTAGCSGSGPGAVKPPARADHGATSPTASEGGHNRALAVAEAARVLASIPVPPGATSSTSAPTRVLRHLRVYDNPVDPSLTRTRWWVVPMSYRDLVSWYDARSPASLGSAYGPGGALSPHGDLDWAVHGRSASYTTPTVVVSYERLGPATTAIRTDVTLASNFERTPETLLPPDVTRIDVTQTVFGNPASTTKPVSTTDPALIATVVAAFNTLRGAPAHALSTPCEQGSEHIYVVTFSSPGHTLTVDPRLLCGTGMGLTLDGHQLPQILERDDSLDAALEAVP